MGIYRVQLWADGQWDGQPYRIVDAESPRIAAELVHGGPLDEQGGSDKIRAQVRPFGLGNPRIFYEC
jgi:hypothetical protein